MTPAPRRAAAAALVLALAQAGCATPPGLEPGRPLEVAALPLPPYQSHEECMTLAPGDRLQYRFESTAPLAFNIHYHEGRAVVMPVTRERVSADEGTFAPLVAQEYCLMWEAGAEGTTIDYTLRLTRGRPK
jgi:hypothetical protein